MSTQARDPMVVAEELNDASNDNDLERVVRLFADDGFIRQLPTSPPDTEYWMGKQKIREWFEPQLQNFAVKSRNMRVDGDTVTWDATVSGDMVRQIGIDSFDVRAEVSVKDGKIASFVVTQTPESVDKFRAAMQRGTAASA